MNFITKFVFVRQLEQTLSAITTEKDALLKSVESDRLKIAQLKENLRRSRSRAEELATRLSSSFQAREESLHAAARLDFLFFIKCM